VSLLAALARRSACGAGQPAANEAPTASRSTSPNTSTPRRRPRCGTAGAPATARPRRGGSTPRRPAVVRQIRRRYRSDPQFQDAVNRYTQEFERLLARIARPIATARSRARRCSPTPAGLHMLAMLRGGWLRRARRLTSPQRERGVSSPFAGGSGGKAAGQGKVALSSQLRGDERNDPLHHRGERAVHRRGDACRRGRGDRRLGGEDLGGDDAARSRDEFGGDVDVTRAPGTSSSKLRMSRASV